MYNRIKLLSKKILEQSKSNVLNVLNIQDIGLKAYLMSRQNRKSIVPCCKGHMRV